MTAGPEEVAAIAQNLVRNCGWAVFPCSDSKAPTRPKWRGGGGYKDATTDPAKIEWLWNLWPGPLIGIATGEMSGIDVLDIDVKHAVALEWWDVASQRIPPTRVYRTRSGGVHAYFQHGPGIANTQSKLAQGVDSRGDGGYVIHWFAAGTECLDHSPPAPWPGWLHQCLLWKPEPKVISPALLAAHPDRAVDGILKVAAGARDGERNAVLFWSACRIKERIIAAQIGRQPAFTRLLTAALAAGLDEKEATRTIQSAWRSVP